MAARRGGKNGSGRVRDVTVQILTSIRDEIRTMRTDLTAAIDRTNERLDQTNERLDQTNIRLDRANDRLDRVEHRLDLHGQALTKLIGEVRGMNERIDNVLTGAHRAEHEELRARLMSVEEKIALRR